MKALSRLLYFGLLSLLVVPALHAEGLDDIVRRYMRDYALRARVHTNIPSFSRQTGLACSACHTAFPHLTQFGRLFKLNGYTLTALQMVQAGDSGKRPSLKLDLIPPVSAMAISSYTATGKAIPGTQNGTAQFPQQISLFFGEAITPRIGTFLQVTYDPVAGSIGMDNADIRFANRMTLGEKSVIYGVTLNNNPTVQDVLNSVPAWRFPYTSSAVAPTPAATVLLDGQLGQQVAGLGGYASWDNHLYAEVSGYRSAAQGGAAPADSTSTNTIGGIAPYWRAFWHQQLGTADLMIGTIGMRASMYPTGATGPRNSYTDVGFDADYDVPIGEGKGGFMAHAIYLHENQNLGAAVATGTAANTTNSLNTIRLDASWYTPSRLGFTAGYFSTTGTSDALRYPAGAVGGSVSGSPNSNGLIFELSALPWLNTRFELQYVVYNKFNGSGTNYDGFGRKAADNNTLYVASWVVF